MAKLIVAKTSRLLNYANVHKNVSYAKATENDKTYINIDYIDDPIFGRSVPDLDEIRGITFYCDNPEKVVLLLNKSKIDQNEIQVNNKTSE